MPNLCMTVLPGQIMRRHIKTSDQAKLGATAERERVG
jgi:hypothetical protein